MKLEDIKVGMKLRVVDNAKNLPNIWSPRMDSIVGKVCEVVGFYHSPVMRKKHVKLHVPGGWKANSEPEGWHISPESLSPLSNWHPKETPPVHKGIYRIQATTDGFSEWYSYWNGECWSWFVPTLQGVNRCYKYQFFYKNHPGFSWQGLVYNPEEVQ